MRILYDHQIYSRQRYGGISRYFHEIANRISRIPGHHVEIFAPLHINEYSGPDDPVPVNGYKIPTIRYSARATRAINGALAYASVRRRRDVDIYHETYFTMSDGAPASAKRVVTVYDMIHELMPDEFPASDSTRQAKAHAVRRADHVVCISENTRRDLIRLLGVPRHKTSVVYLGHSLTDAPAPHVHAPGGRPFLLYVGARGGHKNFKTLLLAFSQSTLLKHEFRIVCFGGGSLTSDESLLIEEVGLDETHVSVRGGSDAVLSGLYSGAAALVYPSLYEGFGIPPLESMSLGCPVICTNASSLPEVVGDAAEMFDPLDATQLRAAIEAVITSPERKRELIELGRHRVLAFSWERCARETLDVYQHILGQ